MLDARRTAAQLDGQSLVIPAFEPHLVDPNRPVYCTIYQIMSGRPRFFTRSVRRGRWSLFEESYAGNVELYDLFADQREHVNLADLPRYAPTASELRSLFSRISEDNLYRISEGLD